MCVCLCKSLFIDTWVLRDVQAHICIATSMTAPTAVQLVLGAHTDSKAQNRGIHKSSWAGSLCVCGLLGRNTISVSTCISIYGRGSTLRSPPGSGDR